MNKDLIVKICTGVEIVGVLSLMGIALKSSNDCYKAECKLIDKEIELGFSKLNSILKDVENRKLKDKIKELENK